MKKSVVVLLLTLLAVVTIFTAISCKGLPAFGGPDMPDQKGILFIDLGSGWEPVSSLPGEYVGMYINPQMFNDIGPNDVYRIDHYSNWENNTNKITVKGDRIKIAYRLTEEDKVTATTIGSIVIQALGKKSEVAGSYTDHQLVACPSWSKNVPDVDLTNYSKGYVYKEFVLPSSQINGYHLYIDYRLLCLEKH